MRAVRSDVVYLSVVVEDGLSPSHVRPFRRHAPLPIMSKALKGNLTVEPDHVTTKISISRDTLRLSRGEGATACRRR